jgi:hypothetical protein
VLLLVVMVLLVLLVATLTMIVVLVLVAPPSVHVSQLIRRGQVCKDNMSKNNPQMSMVKHTYLCRKKTGDASCNYYSDSVERTPRPCLLAAARERVETRGGQGVDVDVVDVAEEGEEEAAAGTTVWTVASGSVVDCDSSERAPAAADRASARTAGAARTLQ